MNLAQCHAALKEMSLAGYVHGALSSTMSNIGPVEPRDGCR